MNTREEIDKVTKLLKAKGDQIDALIAQCDNGGGSDREIIALLMKTIDIAGEVIDGAKGFGIKMAKRNLELEALLKQRTQ